MGVRERTQKRGQAPERRTTRLARVVHVLLWGKCDARVKGAAVLLGCWCGVKKARSPPMLVPAQAKGASQKQGTLGRWPGARRRVW